MNPRPSDPATQLRDIKPPVPIDDWSLYLYWGAIVLGVLVLVAALFYLVRTLRAMRRVNRRREALEALKRIDWTDPKKGAYEATRLGRLLLLPENTRLEELYRQMVSELEAYKYKKEVTPLSDKARAQYDLFVKACDESL